MMPMIRRSGNSVLFVVAQPSASARLINSPRAEAIADLRSRPNCSVALFVGHRFQHSIHRSQVLLLVMTHSLEAGA